MKLAFVDIQNFRKLKSCRIAFSDKETVFVGANNSGKTSAMDALILFLKQSRRRAISTTDFTLSNWHYINNIGTKWIECSNLAQLNLDIGQWLPLLPSVDVWLDVDNSEIHYVSHLIPTLSWSGGQLGVRLSFEPKDPEEIYKEFKESFDSACKVSEISSKSKNEDAPLTLWPQSMQDFLDRHLHRHFTTRAYLLDPTKLSDFEGAVPQPLPNGSVPLEQEPFEGLFKIDIINAQRGFSDAKTSDSPGSEATSGRLTTQFRNYFDKHLNPSVQPTEKDIDALIAIETAKNEFDQKLKISFKSAISELEDLGYPGFSDPQIVLTSKINPVDGLEHDSAIQFNVTKDDESTDQLPLSLPEKYNGLGYQNLISMVFKLIRFRDEWMREGKASNTLDNQNNIIEPVLKFPLKNGQRNKTQKE